MSIEQLREEILEYHLRVEEVLSGMDGVLIGLSNRLFQVEKRVFELETNSSGNVIMVKDDIDDLKQRVAALGAAIADLTLN